jgi:hypothetical protein
MSARYERDLETIIRRWTSLDGRHDGLVEDLGAVKHRLDVIEAFLSERWARWRRADRHERIQPTRTVEERLRAIEERLREGADDDA